MCVFSKFIEGYRPNGYQLAYHHFDVLNQKFMGCDLQLSPQHDFTLHCVLIILFSTNVQKMVLTRCQRESGQFPGLAQRLEVRKCSKGWMPSREGLKFRRCNRISFPCS